MNEEQYMVMKFHEEMGYTVNKYPQIIDLIINVKRLEVIREEVNELEKGIMNINIVEIADAIADLLYMLLGTAIVHGINMKPIFEAIHKSNMTKDKPNTYLEKAIKGENYVPPNLIPILRDQIKRGLRK